ncbi:Asparagine synthetase glutamine-hydrolyzing [Paramagnetospirillum magnetotacticum MS-1]|uniref:asparagine synthase (glutamine-hydrolyzing) n=1 Tax=Paramagnetospirillum magnetotacticum MS-1 TaxID=272627 RepID=A0A0C2YSW7_PARME|nr:asparagine synthase (glutamine-hydrolyzing) [Paramagnetospirillum magnetotacticum]KIL97815.1 Asparagine synthetase glutamine-hydrolyzing [Paramagnetospirillum magnetotacticum MS-1]
MCGLAALFSYRADAPPPDAAELARMTGAMTRRGPDGEGVWSGAEGRVRLGHRRLSIIELGEPGAQPMIADDGKTAIVFNGEIYNYRALRLRLEQQGVRLRSHSDTEVILEGYRLLGPDILAQLRGMFALAIWDGERGGILAARDGLGIKPLYVADDGRTVRLASQVKALLAGGGIETAPDPAGHAGFFLWGHVPEPHTLYRSIRALKPGTWERWGLDGRRDSGAFFDLGAELRRPRQAPRADLKSALEDSVAHHLVADVPVGVFLSAGRDSTTLAAMAAKLGTGKVKSVTLAFEEFAGTPKDEAPLAELAARHYATEHITRRIPGGDFAACRDQILADMDQPTIDGVNVWFVARAARESGLKVALSGLGGDELFAGYDNFTTIPRIVSVLGPSGAIPGLGRGFRALAGHFVRPKLAGLLELGTTLPDAYLLRRGLFMPWELPQVMDADMARIGLEALAPRLHLKRAAAGLGDDVAAISALEMQFYMRNQLLRDADWAGMAHSLEIRVPLVDTHLLDAVLDLRAAGRTPGKADMAACADPGLPTAILERPKTGFFVPVAQWLGESSLRGWAKRVHAALCEETL